MEFTNAGRDGTGVPIGCAVLAVHAAREFRTSKLLTSLDGEPVIRSVVAAACGSACARVAVIYGPPGIDLAVAIGGFEVDHVENRRWHQGLTSFVRATVTWARAHDLGALLIAAADWPLADAAHAGRLIAASGDGRKLASSRRNGVIGLPAVFPRASWDALNALSGDFGPRTFAQFLGGSAEVPL